MKIGLFFFQGWHCKCQPIEKIADFRDGCSVKTAIDEKAAAVKTAIDEMAAAVKAAVDEKAAAVKAAFQPKGEEKNGR